MTENDKPIWVNTVWPTHDLHNQKVEFEFHADNTPVTGLGKFRVFENPAGLQEIEIVITQLVLPGHFADTIYTLEQANAGCITIHPDQSIAKYKLVS